MVEVQTVNELKIAWLKSALGGTTYSSILGLEFDFYSKNSGLTPISKYSVSDHKLAFLRSKLGLSVGSSISVVDAERQYWAANGGVGDSYQDRQVDFFKNHPYDFDARLISGLAAWYSASQISDITLDSDNTTRADTAPGTLGNTATGVTWQSGGASTARINGNKITSTTDSVPRFDGKVSSGFSWSGVVTPVGQNNPDSGLMIRGSLANSDGLYFLLQGNNIIPYTRTGGGGFTNASANFAASGSFTNTQNVPMTMRIDVTNVDAKVYLDGNYRGVYTFGALDSSLVSNTGVGMRVQAVASWTNFTLKTLALSDGSQVSIWPDLSGNNRHAVQTTVAKQPLYRTSNPNLLSYDNATFEGSVGTYAQAASTAARSTAQFLHGVASMAITITAALFARMESPLTPVTAGNTYSAVASIKTDATSLSRNFRVDLQWFNAGGSPISTSIGGVVASTTVGWTQATINAVAPAGAVNVKLHLVIPSAVVAEIHYIDAVGLFAGIITVWVPPVTLANSKPAVQFDGVNDVLNLVSTPASSGGFTIFLVSNPSSNTNTYQVAGSASDADGNNPAIISGYGGLKWEYYRNINGGTQDRKTIAGAGVSTGYHVISVKQTDAVSLKTYLDGVQATSSVPTTAISPLSIARMGAATSDGLTGAAQTNIVEVVVYHRDLTDLERQQVESSLKSKYGTP